MRWVQNRSAPFIKCFMFQLPLGPGKADDECYAGRFHLYGVFVMYEDESQDAEQVNADTVLGRIEEFVLSWLTILVDDDAPAPAFDVLRRTENNVTLVAEPGATAALLHGDQRVTKRLTNTGARSYVQILCVLLFCQTLLQEGRTATVREFWYHCKSNHADIFRTQADADNALMDASSLLGVARHQLGLLASARGFIVGPLRFSQTEVEEEGEAWVDCSQRPRLIDSSWITAHVQVDVSRCRYILVVEKESVFRRLWEDGLTATLGGIVMVTGKGYPDLATRACVKRLSTAATNLPVIGMCDLNPHGVALLLTYRVGSARLAQSGDYAVKLRWMGLRPSQASDLDLDDRVWQDFTDNDASKVKALLKRSFVTQNEEWGAELRSMAEAELKCELEALSAIEPYALVTFVQRCIMRRDFV